MSGRAPFTSDEDALLVKYIAVYNPTEKGRSGNHLYKKLCEDAERKWKWSQAHPWQSWRDRYYKHQVEFDRRIKKYRKKHGLLDKDASHIDQPAHTQASGDDGKEEDVKATLKRIIEKSERSSSSPKKRKRDNKTGYEKKAEIDEEVNKQEYAFRKKRREEVEGPAIIKHKPSEAHESLKEAQKSEQEESKGGRENKDTEQIQLKSTNQIGGEEKGNDGSPKIQNHATQTGLVLFGDHSLHDDQHASIYPDIQVLPLQTLQQSTVLDDGVPAPSTPAVNSLTQSLLTPSRSHSIPQAIASSSKNLLSPSHHLSEAQLNAATAPLRRKLKVKDDVFFRESQSQDNPEEDYERPKYRKPLKLSERLYGNRYLSKQKGVEDSDEEIPSWPPMRGKQCNKGKESESPNATRPDADFKAIAPQNWRANHVVAREFALGGKSTARASSKAFRGESGDAKRGESNTEKFSTNSVIPVKLPDDPFIARNGNKWLFVDNLRRRHTVGSTGEVQRSSGQRVDLRAQLALKRIRNSSNYVRAHSMDASQKSTPNTSLSIISNNSFHRRSSLLPIPVADEDREKIEYLGVSKAIEMMSKNFGFRNEYVWRAWEIFRSISRTEDFCRRFKEKTKNIEDEVLADMERDGLNMEALFNREEPQASGDLDMDPESKGSSSRRPVSALTPSASQTSSQRVPEKFRIKPLPIERAMSEYTPPTMSRAGQYVKLVKRGRKDKAVLREGQRASGAGAIFPSLRSSPATPYNIGSVDSERTVDSKRIQRKEPSEEEKVLLLSANHGIAAQMRLIEQRIGSEYMLQWTVAQLAKLRDQFEEV